MLVEHGADPNLADVTGKAALYTAVDARNEERLFSRPIAKRSNKINSLQFMTLLLDRGANPNARLSRSLLQKAHNAGDATLGAGSTPFMRAAKAGDVAAMRLLIDRGADPTLVQANGTTALMIAAGAGQGGGGDDEEVVEGAAGAAIEATKLCLRRATSTRRTTLRHSRAAAAKGADGIIRFPSTMAPRSKRRTIRARRRSMSRREAGARCRQRWRCCVVSTARAAAQGQSR
jgi:hypothetical protein